MYTVPEPLLPFENSIYDYLERAEKAASDEERQKFLALAAEERIRVYANLSPWERVQLARHPKRPRMLDYTSRLFDDFIELHGDRAIGDDPAMVCGIASFKGQTVFVTGQQKGVTTEEKVARNFGMAHPKGYRKALRIFKMAERLGFPIVSFVDTPAAHPGIEAEQHGQGLAIAQNLLECSRLNTPMMSIVLSEGGSGGAQRAPLRQKRHPRGHVRLSGPRLRQLRRYQRAPDSRLPARASARFFRP